MTFLKDKRVVAFFAALIIVIFLFFSGMHQLSSSKKELAALKGQRNELFLLKDEYLSLKQRIDSVEGRKSQSGPQGIVQAVDEVFQSMGLKDKIKTLKSTGKREIRDGFEENADLSIEKVTMNEMVNILYRIENAPMVLTMKKVTIKKSFENPELMNISLDLSFLKTK
jgi:general secretion pathway protein M